MNINILIMKRLSIFILTSAVLITLFNGCGPSEEEQRQREQARQDSLEQVRQQQMEQQRLDRIARARQDSLEAAKREEEERNRITFDENGNYAVQVEAWRSKEKAQAQISKWNNRGFENAYVVKYGNEERGDVWFRVRLGRFATENMAEKFQTILQEDYNARSWVSYVGQGQ